MRSIAAFILAVVAATLAGCAEVQKFSIEVSTENLKRIETEKTIAANFKTAYCTWEGPKTRALLGDEIKKMPAEVTEIMNELDSGCKDETALPRWWGLYERYYVQLVLAAIEKYAPKVFEQILKFAKL